MSKTKEKPPLLERELERQFTAALKRMGAVSYKWVSPSSVGVPDRIVIWPKGQVHFVELKARNGRLSVAQYGNLDILARQGAQVYVLRGEKEVEQYLTHNEKLRAPRDDTYVHMRNQLNKDLALAQVRAEVVSTRLEELLA
jgi:hypothetical protein